MAGNAKKTTELYVTTKNEVGALARATLPLKQNSINIECYCAYESDNEACFHFVTSNNTQAKKCLTDAGFNCTEKPVVFWNAGNTPGTLNTATTAVAEAKINVTYTYCTTPTGSNICATVWQTNNNDKACDILNKF